MRATQGEEDPGPALGPTGFSNISPRADIFLLGQSCHPIVDNCQINDPNLSGVRFDVWLISDWRIKSALMEVWLLRGCLRDDGDV